MSPLIALSFSSFATFLFFLPTHAPYSLNSNPPRPQTDSHSGRIALKEETHETPFTYNVRCDNKVPIQLCQHARRAVRPRATQPRPPSNFAAARSLQAANHLPSPSLPAPPSISNRTPVYQPLKHRYANLYVCPAPFRILLVKRCDVSCHSFLFERGSMYNTSTQHSIWLPLSIHLDSTHLPAGRPSPIPNDVW